MANRDDMILRPQVKRKSERSVPERAAEERRTDVYRRRRSRRLARLRRAAASRQITRRRPAGRKGFGLGKAGRATALRGATRALGLAAIAVESILLGGRIARRLGGASERLIAAQDAHTIFGDLDEQATAASRSRDFIESKPHLLRLIGQEDHVNSQILEIAADIRKTELRGARGEDILERSPGLDSASTMTDRFMRMLLEQANALGLREESDEAMRALGEHERDGVWK